MISRNSNIPSFEGNGTKIGHRSHGAIRITFISQINENLSCIFVQIHLCDILCNYKYYDIYNIE